MTNSRFLRRSTLLAAGSLGAVLVFVALVQRPDAHEQGADTATEGSAPVEDDMHEFMEYAFQPTYERLKQHMAAAPADNAGWKAVKSDSLLLAEGGNLLLLRQPDEDANDWVQHSTQVRDLGGQLYQAAKKKDYAAARRHYQTMLTRCNACHDQFAGGEHQLTP